MHSGVVKVRVRDHLTPPKTPKIGGKTNGEYFQKIQVKCCNVSLTCMGHGIYTRAYSLRINLKFSHLTFKTPGINSGCEHAFIKKTSVPKGFNHRHEPYLNLY